MKDWIKKLAFLRYPDAVKAVATVSAMFMLLCIAYTVLAFGFAVACGPDHIAGLMVMFPLISMIIWMPIMLWTQDFTVSYGDGRSEYEDILWPMVQCVIGYYVLTTFAAFWLGAVIWHGVIGFLAMACVTAFLVFCVAVFAAFRFGMDWLGRIVREEA